MKNSLTAVELANRVAEILDSKKGQDISIISLGHLTVIAEKFVICTANSAIQVRALSDAVELELKQQGIELVRSDGYKESRWIVMDYGHVIVHVFHRDEREFYNIERLWADGSNIEKYISIDDR